MLLLMVVLVMCPLQSWLKTLQCSVAHHHVSDSVSRQLFNPTAVAWHGYKGVHTKLIAASRALPDACPDRVSALRFGQLNLHRKLMRCPSRRAQSQASRHHHNLSKDVLLPALQQNLSALHFCVQLRPRTGRCPCIRIFRTAAAQ